MIDPKFDISQFDTPEMLVETLVDANAAYIDRFRAEHEDSETPEENEGRAIHVYKTLIELGLSLTSPDSFQIIIEGPMFVDIVEGNRQITDTAIPLHFRKSEFVACLESEAESFPTSIRTLDDGTQRATGFTGFPRDGSNVTITQAVELLAFALDAILAANPMETIHRFVRLARARGPLLSGEAWPAPPFFETRSITIDSEDPDSFGRMVVEQCVSHARAVEGNLLNRGDDGRAARITVLQGFVAHAVHAIEDTKFNDLLGTDEEFMQMLPGVMPNDWEETRRAKELLIAKIWHAGQAQDDAVEDALGGTPEAEGERLDQVGLLESLLEHLVRLNSETMPNPFFMRLLVEEANSVTFPPDAVVAG